MGDFPTVDILRMSRELRGVVNISISSTSAQLRVWFLDPHNAWGQERTGGSTEHFSGKYCPAFVR